MSILLNRCMAALVVCGFATTASAAPPHRHHRRMTSVAASRSLTIGGRPHGIYRVGNTIVAPGGFSAHGYGYPVATPQDRAAAGLDDGAGAYGYGFDGLGVAGFGDDLEAGYDNPAYGNGFNGYLGYGDVPSQLAFGPGFANRHISGEDPLDRGDVGPGPSPEDLGYGAIPTP